MKSVIFLAPPAAGKGTFSDYLIKHYGYKQLSTGDILRGYAKNDASLAEILKSGQLACDDVIMNIVEKELKMIPEGVPFILDGIPRTLQQAKKLDIILSGLTNLDVVVVYIDVNKEILTDRVIGRRICEKCHRSYNILISEFKPKDENLCDDCRIPLVQRKDDNLESFKIRYTNFIESTYPVVAYYKEKGCLRVLQNNEVDQTNALDQLKEILDDDQK